MNSKVKIGIVVGISIAVVLGFLLGVITGGPKEGGVPIGTVTASYEPKTESVIIELPREKVIGGFVSYFGWRRDNNIFLTRLEGSWLQDPFHTGTHYTQEMIAIPMRDAPAGKYSIFVHGDMGVALAQVEVTKH